MPLDIFKAQFSHFCISTLEPIGQRWEKVGWRSLDLAIGSIRVNPASTLEPEIGQIYVFRKSW